MMKRLSLAFAVVAMLALCAIAPAQEADETSARDQALKLYMIFKNREWKSLRAIIAFSPTVEKATPDDPDKFAKDFESGLTGTDTDNNFAKVMDNLSDVKVGAAVVEGKSAYVSTSSLLTLNGTKLHFVGLIKLVKVGETWKWDLTYSDDVEKATEKRFSQLLGESSKVD